MSPYFLTRRVSRLLGLALVSWASARVGVHRPSLRLPYLSVFHSLFFTCIVFIHFYSASHSMCLDRGLAGSIFIKALFRLQQFPSTSIVNKSTSIVNKSQLVFTSNSL